MRRPVGQRIARRVEIHRTAIAMHRQAVDPPHQAEVITAAIGAHAPGIDHPLVAARILPHRLQPIAERVGAFAVHAQAAHRLAGIAQDEGQLVGQHQVLPFPETTWRATHAPARIAIEIVTLSLPWPHLLSPTKKPPQTGGGIGSGSGKASVAHARFPQHVGNTGKRQNETGPEGHLQKLG